MKEFQRSASKFNEEPEHDLSEMDFERQDREHGTATFALEVRRSVRKAHRGLGHPPFNRFFRLLRLGGASKAPLECAKTLALHHVSDGKPLQTCRYSQFQQLTDCSRQHISTTTSKTTRLQDYTTKGWRFALMPPWASRHIGGSRSMPTVHRCRKDGRPWVALKAPQTTMTRQQDTHTLTW